MTFIVLGKALTLATTTFTMAVGVAEHTGFGPAVLRASPPIVVASQGGLDVVLPHDVMLLSRAQQWQAWSF